MEPILVLAHVHEWRDTRVQDALADRVLDVRSIELGDAVPTDARPFSGVVIGGGVTPVSAVDEHAFLRDELALIESALAADVPLLGICLGGQLLAHALGASVRGGPPEIGYCAIEPLDAELDELTHVFQWHWQGFGLPAGATRLARSNGYDTQAFSYGKARAIQFHPDVRHSDVAAWLAGFPVEHGRPDESEQLALAERHDPVIERWFERFLEGLF